MRKIIIKVICFICFYFNVLLIHSNSKLIEVPYKLYFGSFYSHFTIGNPSQILNHAIDQEREFSWSATDFYNRSISMTQSIIKESKLRFRHLNLYGAILEDSISLINNDTNYTINDFPFYVINSTKGFNSRVGGWGFASKFRDERFSIMHRYKKQGFIDYLAYSFVPNDTVSIMYIGGIPKETISNKHSASCYLNRKYSNWACDLSYIFIGNISYVYDNVYYNNHDHALFQVAEKRILVPEAFMSYLNETYFQQYILNKKCRNQYTTMNREFVCECDVRSQLPQLNFIFNSRIYTIKAYELFEVYGQECYFMIASNHIREGNWIFGSVFLKRFISLFDYEQSLITFYSTNPIETIDLERIFPWKRVLRWSMIILIMVIIVISLRIGYNRMNMKKRRKKESAKIVEQYEEMH